MKELDLIDLRIVCIVCLTVLAVAALVVDGSMGETLLVAISGFMGTIIGWGFGKNAALAEVKDDDKEV